jgi:DNA-binding CsgD family transcriptional regulator
MRMATTKGDTLDPWCDFRKSYDIRREVSTGCTNIQVATKLHISKYAVAQHIAKTLKRVGTANRTDLVSRAYIAGILSDEPGVYSFTPFK